MNDKASMPLVSVICTAYNHEKYIRKCLDGFVMQKTTFPFEVIVHDDASTDHTADIIMEYAKKYPQIIRPIIQKENQYSQKIRIGDNYMYPIARGKYCALCEGDDYWIDPYKLQKQAEALESHPDCQMCVGKAVTVYEDGTPGPSVFPKQQLQTGVISSREFLKMAFSYSFHTSSYFYKTSQYRKLIDEMPEFKKQAPVGDQVYLLYYGQLGPIYYINDALSVYRMNSIAGWSASNRASSEEKQIDHQKKMINMYNLYDQYTGQKYHDLCQMGIRKREFEILRIKGDYRGQLSRQFKDVFVNLPKDYQRKVVIASFFPKIAKRIQNQRKEKRAMRA